jgi:hypothetical protein
MICAATRAIRYLGQLDAISGTTMMTRSRNTIQAIARILNEFNQRCRSRVTPLGETISSRLAPV